ncbi:dihydrolipoyl dehydrogenase [Capnocytophaga catalasegens]|uniref:Dihydrolipoyl dehydrogenase n=1 Tax=Capnocytophaga catalasegens TaxID=1004260 RepID=A0AAV5AR10_9FLAO|nr:dihydrolipoyl dehydrogenase [Capnocytophaga catalasegens]GIZ15255.1 dihydrolipoyl dehydrogenase [Capnocytophaga catalasegens]GJM49769.1 dihydrolipoyl dehydrogenase [Capnocytophaga catalasegens]GJM52834.1 dihydrolipoyl dehydrogenase [Capnocytophaga catalasegens]
MKTYDVVVIGSGPGGYVSAIRCAQLGLKTALVEKYDTLGGTCLNVGCIPSKALLDSSHRFEIANKHAKEYGVEILGSVKANLPVMIACKQSVVEQTCQGIVFLMDKNKIDVYYGVASFVSANQIKIAKKDGTLQEISTKNTIIATGSKPASLPFISIDKERIITSTEALKLQEIPKHLIVIGGGVIGLELGQVYHRLGAEVSVVEYADSILPTMDKSVGKELTRVLKKQGFSFYTEAKVKEVTRSGKVVKVKADGKKGEIVLEGDYCLVAVGRKPYTDGLGLDRIGVQTDERGRIVVDNHLQTRVSGVYAIGDVVPGAMLAHKAEEEGVFVAEHLAGQKPHVNYDLIPGAIYTTPEVACVGKTEEELKAAGVAYKVGQFPMRALGRARASAETDGFVKILADKNTDEVLGVHIIGARASDLIAQAVTAMEFRASAEDIARICHAHPTFSEALKEAALDATEKRAIHA